MGKERMDFVIRILLAIAGVLLLANLQNGYLWQDEAETALLARNTLRFGYPRAVDGRNVIEIPSHGYGPGESWIYSPWLPFYLLAGVFALLGESTWSARVAFALFGWVSIYLTWRVVSQLTTDRRIQRLSVALLTFSVPFLLHMRQCRYYAMTTAWVVGIAWAYLVHLDRPSRRHLIALGVLLVLLFHTNFGTFLPILGTLILHQGIWGQRSMRRPFTIMCGWVAGLVLPWVLFFYRPAFVGAFSLHRVVQQLTYYVRITNKYFIPLAFFMGMALLWWLTHRAQRPPGYAAIPQSSKGWFLVMLVAVNVTFLLIPDQRHMRYLIPMVPFLLIGEAFWLTGWWHRNVILRWVAVLTALCPTFLHVSTQPILLTEFAYELTHRYVGPMEGVVGYLREHGRPHQTVKIPYDERSLMWYLDMTIEPPSQFLQDTDPDWIVLRRQQEPLLKAFVASPSFRRIETRYERIVLDVPDAYWQNREDPGEHHFRTMHEASRLVIYRKREPHG